MVRHFLKTAGFFFDCTELGVINQQDFHPGRRRQTSDQIHEYTENWRSTIVGAFKKYSLLDFEQFSEHDWNFFWFLV